MSESGNEQRRSTDGLMNEMRQDIKALLQSDAAKQELLKSIEKQTIKTNGRVTTLEDKHEKLQKSHDGIINRAIGWAACAGIVVTVLWKLFVR